MVAGLEGAALTFLLSEIPWEVGEGDMSNPGCTGTPDLVWLVPQLLLPFLFTPLAREGLGN